MSRLSPVLPFALMNFVLSLMQVRKRDYLYGSLLGMLPRTTFFYWLGTQAKQLYELLQNPTAGNQQQLLFLGLLIISVFGIIYYLTRAVQKALRKPAA